MHDDDVKLWYFAYGSNMQRATFERRRGMRPQRSVWGRLDGYRLCFDLPVGPGERGVANLCVDVGDCVFGVLYLITSVEFDFLDRTEGVPQGYYRRLQIDVEDRHGESLTAWTYVSGNGRVGRKPSARYMGLLLDGAREHDLPLEYVARLRAFELAIDERVTA